MVLQPRLLHQDEAERPQVIDQPLGSNSGHEAVGVVDAFSALELQGMGNGPDQVVVRGWSEPVLIVLGTPTRWQVRFERTSQEQGKRLPSKFPFEDEPLR